MNLSNKFAIVTGASTGIGREISRSLAREGATVALVSRSKEKLAETKSLIEKENGKVEIFVCDLTQETSIDDLVVSIKKKTSQVDILVNVAGIWHGEGEVYAGQAFETFSKQVIRDTFTVGLIAPTLLTHALIPLMHKGSSIINVSGTFESGAKGWLPYYVSKRGIEDLTVGLAQELKEKGIRVNAISPSDVATDAYKKYFPQYIADAIAPEEIGKFAVELSLGTDSGKVFVLKKGQAPYDKFHA